MPVVRSVVASAFTASNSFIAFVHIGGSGSRPRSTENLPQTLDELLKRNQQWIRKNQHLSDEISSLRNHPANSQIPMEQAQTLDYLTQKNQESRGKNKQLLAEMASVQSKLAVPSQVSSKMKIKKTIAEIAAWLLSHVRGTL